MKTIFLMENLLNPQATSSAPN